MESKNNLLINKLLKQKKGYYKIMSDRIKDYEKMLKNRELFIDERKVEYNRNNELS